MEGPSLDVAVTVSIELRRLSGLVRALMSDAPEDLEKAELLVLLDRAGPPHRLGATELTAALSITSGALTGRLDRLQAEGLITRDRDPADRRQITVTMTDAGRARLAAARHQAEHSIQRRLLHEVAAAAKCSDDGSLTGRMSEGELHVCGSSSGGGQRLGCPDVTALGEVDTVVP